MDEELKEIQAEVIELEEFFLNEDYESEYIDLFLPTKNY